MLSMHQHLQKNDQQRIAIRQAAKRFAQSSASKSVEVYIPPMHLQPEHDQLRTIVPWHYNGFIVKLPGYTLAVDPGVNFAYRLQLGGFDITSIDGIFVSHDHIDHVHDAAVLIEILHRIGKGTVIYTTHKTIDDGKISRYHAGLEKPDGLTRTTFIEDSQQVELPNGMTMEFVALHHGTPCYGLRILMADKLVVGYISDTGYSKELLPLAQEFVDPKKALDNFPDTNAECQTVISGASLAICNIDGYWHNKNSLTHMAAIDAAHLLGVVRPDRALLTHLNPMGELPDANQWCQDIATEVAQLSGISVQAAGPDGITIQV